MSFQGSNRRRDWGPSLGIPLGSGATVESEKLEEDGEMCCHGNWRRRAFPEGGSDG